MKIVRGRQPAGALHLSFDRKVSPTGTWQESRRRWIPTTPNSFGLPSGSTCPGATEFCESCYGAASEQSAGVAELLERNRRLLVEAGTVDAMADLLDEMITNYRDTAQPAKPERLFRIHWDGDFFSIDYAEAWARVIAANPDIMFWAYTRSFTPEVNVVPVLVGLDNLALYLSVDDANAARAQEVLDEWPNVLVALCGVDYQSVRGLVDLGGVEPLACPENTGRLPLMSEHGGACVTCGVCPEARRDVMFTTSHREDASVAAVQIRASGRPPGAGEDREWECAGPGCTVVLSRTVGQRGRPRKFCGDLCRWAARRAAVTCS